MITGRYSALHQAHERIKAERQAAAAPKEMTEARRERQTRERSQSSASSQPADAAAPAERRERRRARPLLMTGKEEPEAGVPRLDPAAPVATPWGPHQAPAPEGTMRMYRSGPIRGVRMEKAEPKPAEPPPKTTPALGETMRHAEWRRVATARIEAARAKKAERAADQEATPLGFIPTSPEVKKAATETAPPRLSSSSYRGFANATEISGPGEDD